MVFGGRKLVLYTISSHFSPIADIEGMFSFNHNARKTLKHVRNILKPFKLPLVYVVFPKTSGFYLKKTSKVAKISLKSLLEVVGPIYA